MNIVDRMLENADLKYKKYNENLIGKNSPIIGIRIPEIRKIAKGILKDNKDSIFFNEYKGVYFEEKMLKGFIVSSSEEYFFKYVDNYLNELDSWCLVDTFCNSCKFINKNKSKHWEFVKSLIKSNKEFIVRCGYVFILYYYLNDEYIDEIIELLHLNFEDYYINMAISWCVCEAYINYPEKIEVLFSKKELSLFVHNKSIDKINDSLRVSISDKVRLRELKYF